MITEAAKLRALFVLLTCSDGEEFPNWLWFLFLQKYNVYWEIGLAGCIWQGYLDLGKA